MTRTASKPLRIFCSYSHKDEEYLSELRTWLRGLERQGLIEWWHDREIVPGSEWNVAIDENLMNADIVLLLVTPDFMASDYVFEKEIDLALERHERGEARVIPIIVTPADWEWAPFGKLQALPKDAEPITTWPNRDQAWLDVVKGIRGTVQLLERFERLRGESDVREQEASSARQTQRPAESTPQTGRRGTSSRAVRSKRRNVSIDVEQGDVFTYEADVLALKYAQAFYGVDRAVADRLIPEGIMLRNFYLESGDFRVIPAAGHLAVNSILFIGVEALGRFRYREIRKFARRTLESLASSLPQTRHLCLTLHGPGFGLDEIEAFEAEVAGLIEAITSDAVPEQLEQITIVERDPRLATRLQRTLPSLLPQGSVEHDLRKYLGNLEESETRKFRSVGYASETKPRIFVAMPFVDEMEDTFHYGIQRAAEEADFLCERADLSAFTGDVLDWVKKRIEGSNLIIADLSDANPNVYLEVGYAWGRGIPTVLLVRELDDAKFDVRGQRILTYKRIQELEEKLGSELEALRRELPSESQG